MVNSDKDNTEQTISNNHCIDYNMLLDRIDKLERKIAILEKDAKHNAKVMQHAWLNVPIGGYI